MPVGKLRQERLVVLLFPCLPIDACLCVACALPRCRCVGARRETSSWEVKQDCLEDWVGLAAGTTPYMLISLGGIGALEDVAFGPSQTIFVELYRG